jgi:hypothetical protein
MTEPPSEQAYRTELDSILAYHEELDAVLSPKPRIELVRDWRGSLPTVKSPTLFLPRPHPGQEYVISTAQRFNWLAAGRRWRKTSSVMSIAAKAALKGGSILWGAPVYDQVRVGWDETKRACADLIPRKMVAFNESRMEAKFPGGGKITYRSLDNPDNVRGHTADGVVIDEAAEVAPSAWYEVLRPMLLDTGGWLWSLFTPKGMNWVWEEHSTAGDKADSAAWQAPTLGCRVVNGQLVREPHPLENPEIDWNEMLSLWATMPEDSFKQEILAEFIADSGAVFRFIGEAAIAVPQDAAQHGHVYIVGVDPAQRRDFTVIIVIDATIGEVCYLDRFNQLEYSVQIDRLKAVCERFRPELVVVEETGNLAFVEALYITDYYNRTERQNVGMPVYAFKTTNASKVKIIQDVALAFERRVIRILDNRILRNELLAFTKEKSHAGIIKYSAPAGKHDDCVMSLAFAWSQAKEYLSQETLTARERAARKADSLMPVKARPVDITTAEFWDKTKEIRRERFEDEEEKRGQSWLQQLDGWEVA